jgi:hypothetical protein
MLEFLHQINVEEFRDFKKAGVLRGKKELDEQKHENGDQDKSEPKFEKNEISDAGRQILQTWISNHPNQKSLQEDINDLVVQIGLKFEIIQRFFLNSRIRNKLKVNP